MKYLSIILVILLVACSEIESSEDNKINLGVLIKAEAISTSFNEEPKMLIETDKGFYVIRGYRSFKKGEEVFIKKINIIK